VVVVVVVVLVLVGGEVMGWLAPFLVRRVAMSMGSVVLCFVV